MNTGIVQILGKNEAKQLLLDGLKVLVVSMLLALSAYISIPLPFTPVPVTMQPLAVLLVGGFLGRKMGTLAVITYLAEGAMGLPVFSSGAAGMLCFFGPTGGYLLGFIPAAFIVGWCADHNWFGRLALVSLSVSIGHLVIFSCGLAWLGQFVGYSQVLSFGLYPFAIGAILKTAVAAAVLIRFKF